MFFECSLPLPYSIDEGEMECDGSEDSEKMMHRSKGKRYRKRLALAALAEVAKSPCCKKRCLKHINMASLIFDQKEYQQQSEAEKATWIKHFKKLRTGRNGQIKYMIQKKVQNLNVVLFKACISI
jgi:hypothetical protein